MIQYVLWFIQFITTYVFIIFLFRYWKKEGLLVWSVLAVVLANIQVVKLVSLFGLDATLGNILYVSSFFVTDALNEFYGKKEAQKAMYLSLVASIVYLIYGQLAIAFTPLSFDTTGHNALQSLFYFSPRIVLASLICYWLSQVIDIHIYHKMTIKNLSLWKKNVWSTLLSQALDSFLFVFIAFFGAFEGSLWEQFPIVLQIGLSTYLIKSFVNILDVPFLYLLRKIHTREIELNHG